MYNNYSNFTHNIVSILMQNGGFALKHHLDSLAVRICIASDKITQLTIT